MGFGTMFFGKRHYHSDGSFVTTEFATAFGLPIFPIRSIRILETKHDGWTGPTVAYHKTTYLLLEPSVPLCWTQVAAVYATLVLCIGSLVLFLGATGTQKHPGPIYPYVGQGTLYFILTMVAALWPIVIAFTLRGAARRRAGASGIWLGMAGVRARYRWDHAATAGRREMLARALVPHGEFFEGLLPKGWAELPDAVRILLARFRAR